MKLVVERDQVNISVDVSLSWSFRLGSAAFDLNIATRDNENLPNFRGDFKIFVFRSMLKKQRRLFSSLIIFSDCTIRGY